MECSTTVIDATTFLSTPRRVLLLAVLLCVGGGFTLAADPVKQREFQPMNPTVMAQGGSSRVTATGYAGLFQNPAGLGFTPEPELVLPSYTVWVHSRPDLLLSTIGAFSADETETEDEDDNPILTSLRDQFTTNGFGLGTSLGLGWAGNGLGFGMNLGLDSFLYGETFPLGLEGEINAQFSFAIGYAQPFDLGPVQLSVGGALRPTLRITSFVTSETAANLISTFLGVDTGGDEEDQPELLDTLRALNGWGVAFDAGLMARWRPVTVGVQARNLLNTNMRYSSNTMNEILDALSSGGLPGTASEDLTRDYITPLEVSFGAAWDPDLGAIGSIVDPRIHFEIRDAFLTTDQDRERPRSYWTRLHMGTELRLLSFFDLRLGINQGYVTTGFGVNLGVLRVNYAIYRQEFGRYPGDRPVGGSALEFALQY